MSRVRTARALVVALAMMGGPAPAASHASGSCGAGTFFVGAATGTVDYGEVDDWWQTASAGTTTIVNHGSDPQTILEVHTADCGTSLCSVFGPTTTCTVDYTGILNVRVAVWNSGLSTTYAMTAMSGPTSPSSSCDPGDVPCVAVTSGAEIQRVDVIVPQAGVDPAGHVVGAVDVYRFALPTDGSLSIPCVVLIVDGETSSPCETAGGSFVSRTATLLDRDVEVPYADVNPPPLSTVAICEARVTVTVADVGIEDFPAYALC